MKDHLRLFLIEDDDDIALLIRSSLERAHHTVTRCRTAEDALIVLENGNYDLLLLDQRLPDMAGLDFVGRLAGENVSIPILMVTAYGDEELATSALQAGVLDYVAKDPELAFLSELPKRVRECVEKHELKQANELLIQSLESTLDGIMITDLEGRIRHVNQALIDMTGYSREEMIGQLPRLLKSGRHSPETYAAIWQTIVARQSWQGELTNRRKDGSMFDTSQTISPIIDSQGRLTHFVGIARDITEHKALQRQFLQAQKMQSVGTLAGGIAHEFNNLLAGINGYAALGLREADRTSTLAEYLQHVVDLSERAAGLTGQLLAFARQPTLTRRPSSMVELLTCTAELVNRTLQVEVELEAPSAEGGVGGDLIVEADFNQLQQAVVNLALNARDATREKAWQSKDDGRSASDRGTSPVIFRLREAQLGRERTAFPQNVPRGSYVVIEVEDAGCGMAPEILQQAVDPFFTTKEVGQGTGLGLSVVFGIVQGHQGVLTIDSVKGAGTCTSLWLPRYDDPHASRNGAEVMPATAMLGAPPPSSASHSILVIDDEEAVLHVVRRFLEIAGHRVKCVSSGQAALDWIDTEHELDLVILDLLMPRENSLHVMQRLRERRPDLPVLICTGTVADEQTTRLLDAGARGPLRKPFRITELWQSVNEALGS